MTTNFKNTQHGDEMFVKLREIQPGKPLMVMEFWSGWFDHWGEVHHTMDLNGTDICVLTTKLPIIHRPRPLSLC